MPKLFPMGDDPSGRKITDAELAALMQACTAREDFYWWCREFAFSRGDLGVEYGRARIVEKNKGEYAARNTRGYFLKATFLIVSGVQKRLVEYSLYFEADLPEKRRYPKAECKSQRSFIALLH